MPRRRPLTDLCSIEDCQKVEYKRHWCSAHYSRWYRWGHPLNNGPTDLGIVRFLERTFRPNGLCFEWTGPVLTSGYGKVAVKFQGGIIHTAHKLAWCIANNCVPGQGQVIRHACDNRLCCNPEHLLAGSHFDNYMDALERNRLSTNIKGQFVSGSR